MPRGRLVLQPVTSRQASRQPEYALVSKDAARAVRLARPIPSDLMGRVDPGSSSALRTVFRLVPILTLAVTGGAILPVAADFAQTGVLASSVIFFVVAGANVYTCDLLIAQAHATAQTDLELLALRIGGKWWKLTIEVSLQVLIWGTVATAFCQVGELVAAGLGYMQPDLHSIFQENGGRVVIVVAVFAIAPLSMLKHMHSLEILADAGFLVVLALIVIVIINACSHGLPALHDGSFALYGFDSVGDIAAAVSDFGFMFYLQPIILPMLSGVGVGAGQKGVKLLSWSVWLSILGAASAIYYLTGFFGAARFGHDAVVKGNILDNNLGAGMLQGILNLLFAAYVLIAMAPFELASRNTTELWMQGILGERFVKWRWIVQALGFYFLTAAVALLFPGQSVKALTITGATGVAMICYICPIGQHWLLFFNRAHCQRHSSQNLHIIYSSSSSQPAQSMNENAPLLEGAWTKRTQSIAVEIDMLQHVGPEGSDNATVPQGLQNAYPSFANASTSEIMRQVIVPGLVLLIGVSTSIVTLCTIQNATI